jgi:hypothetical protein
VEEERTIQVDKEDVDDGEQDGGEKLLVMETLQH